MSLAEEQSANPVFGTVGNTDQRSKIGTFDIAPTYTRPIGDNSVFNFGPISGKTSTTTTRAAIRWLTWATKPSEPDHRSKPFAYECRRA